MTATTAPSAKRAATIAPAAPSAKRAATIAPAAPSAKRAATIAPATPSAKRAAAIAPAARRFTRAVVIGPGARRALRDGASGTVELVFGPGGYVLLGGRRVLLAPARSPLGPLSVLVSGLARGDLAPGDAVSVAGGALVAGALRIDLSGARVAPPPVPAASTLAPGWRAALATASTSSGRRRSSSPRGSTRWPQATSPAAQRRSPVAATA